MANEVTTTGATVCGECGTRTVIAESGECSKCGWFADEFAPAPPRLVFSGRCVRVVEITDEEDGDVVYTEAEFVSHLDAMGAPVWLPLGFGDDDNASHHLRRAAALSELVGRLAHLEAVAL